MTLPTTAAQAAATPLVHIVDDEEVVRDALGWLLRSRRLLSQAHASGESFLSHVADASALGPWPREPSCLLLDVRMPGMSGLALFEDLIERGLQRVLPVIFLTGHGDVPTAVAAVKRGAFDFVEKPFSDNALVDRVERALALSRDHLAARATASLLGARLAELTDREHSVMRLVMEGLPNKLIAEELHISVRTVEVHRARVFEKMQVKSAVELVHLLRQMPEPGAAT